MPSKTIKVGVTNDFFNKLKEFELQVEIKS
jgi:hypothetical protein